MIPVPTSDLAFFGLAGNALCCKALQEEHIQEALRSPSVNLVTYRADDEWLTFEIAARQARLNKSFQFWFYNQDIDELPLQLMTALPALGLEVENLNAALLDDVVAVASLLARVGQNRRPFVSLRTIGVEYFDNNKDSVSCCFHRDATVLTAFRTYLGRGTEWVADDNVIRDTFVDQAIIGLRHPLSTFLRRPEEIFSTDVSTIGILKGELCPDSMSPSALEFVTNFIPKAAIPTFNVGRGLIHRGPIIGPHELRLVLTVSSFNNF